MNSVKSCSLLRKPLIGSKETKWSNLMENDRQLTLFEPHFHLLYHVYAFNDIQMYVFMLYLWCIFKLCVVWSIVCFMHAVPWYCTEVHRNRNADVVNFWMVSQWQDDDYQCYGMYNSFKLRQNGCHFADDIWDKFSCNKKVTFWSECHWDLFPGVPLRIRQNSFRISHGVKRTTGH